MRSFAVVLFTAAVAAVMAGCSGPPAPPPIAVSVSASSQATDEGQIILIQAKVANDVSGKGVLWSLTGPGSLSSSSGLSVTYVAPTANVSTSQQATIKATSVADQTKSASAQITVNPLPQMPISQTLASGLVGTPYSQTITLTGGTAPFQWSIYNGPIPTGNYVGGSVPDGLTLNTSTGTISGTPTGGGTWYFEAAVTDATGATAFDGLLSIQINPTAAPANPIPFLNQPLAPTAVVPGSAGFVMNVSGTGFVSGAAVDFNGSALATTFIDNEHLSAVVPAADVTNASTASITVVNPAPGGGRSNVVYFQVGAPQATVNFVNASNSPLQIASPSGLVTSDFNEDGNADLAVAGVSRVSVYLGNNNGILTAAPGSPIPVPSPPFDDFGSPYAGPALGVGDFNESGHQGLAVGLLQNQAAAVLFGNGDGTFTGSGTLANARGAPLMSVAAADFNGDGHLDLMTLGGVNGASPLMLLGYGHGAFNGVTQNFEIVGGGQANESSLAVGDFNGDGKLDVIVENVNPLTGTGAEQILLGNGDGTFTQGTSLNVSGLAAAADFNGDGKLDVAVCDPSTNMVTIFLGDGTGNFTAADFLGVGTQPEAIVAGDFNNDGKLDLAVANFGDNTVSVLLGNGDGTFTFASGQPYAVGKGPISLAAGDFNGDGKLDLAVANLMDGTGTVSILLQP